MEGRLEEAGQGGKGVVGIPSGSADAVAVVEVSSVIPSSVVARKTVLPLFTISKIRFPVYRELSSRDLLFNLVSLGNYQIDRNSGAFE